ncbi:Uma2 family endonuclease [Crocosphaera sp. XPORK-15E]|uniref:Uma2 family endonuclease n=1 Tax=Crocosphaera sp. XPORK-15E TaxID=3110247 RepID=UPI002B220734|nr:Uma2 family endonuclease [Crocosphaera sp. XPORK-15E]MEA5534540.1 Uma2 family endonuclease [Crocosphaera sp. XPORK-15E]
MISTSIKLTFEEYLRQYPQGEGKFELIHGEFVKVEAIRAHKNVARFLVKAFDRESERLKLDYIVDKDIIIRTLTKEEQERGRIPDVSVVKGSIWNANVTTYGAIIEPLELAVEVTSTNWDDDYIDKLDEYERLGIQEYWIVDYLAIASRNYLGNPKVPTVFVYNLIDGKYEVKSFREQDIITSAIFPELKLTVAHILDASGIGKIGY